METRSKAKRKRQLENENRPGPSPSPSPQRKSQRLSDQSQSPSISSDEEDEAKKITDLTDCCLEKIFEYLDMPTLSNVAAANRWLRPAVGVVYKRKHGNSNVCIGSDRSSSFFHTLSRSSIEIIGLKSCLQLLRCLGSSINVWSICYGSWTKKQSDHILQYLNQYCAQNLTEIEFRSKPRRISIKPFEKPFANVRTVEVFCGDLHDQLPSFAEWFPNVRTLKLGNYSRFRHKDNAIKFNHLEHLSFDVDQAVEGMGFTKINATHMLQQHPQLQSLDMVFGNKSFDTMLNIIKDSQAICNLKVHMVPHVGQMIVATVSDIQRLVDEHPLLIEVELTGLKFTPDTIKTISQHNSMKQLRFQVGDRLEYDRLASHLDGQWRSTFEAYIFGLAHLIDAVLLER